MKLNPKYKEAVEKKRATGEIKEEFFIFQMTEEQENRFIEEAVKLIAEFDDLNIFGKQDVCKLLPNIGMMRDVLYHWKEIKES